MVSWIKATYSFYLNPNGNKQANKEKKLENVLAVFYKGGLLHDRKLNSGSHKHDKGEFCGCCLVAQLCLTLFWSHGL